MKKLKLLIIGLCFTIIDKLMDEEEIVISDPELEKLIEGLIGGVDGE